MFSLVVALFIALGVVASQVPARNFYPKIENMKPEDRAACNTAADEAFFKELKLNNGLETAKEYDAFVACAKKLGYPVK